MIHYINQEQIKAYRENPAISQSQLKIEKYEKEEKEKEIKNHTSMLFGSYLDFLITSNEDPSLYYVIEDTKRPSEVIQTLLDQWLFTVGIKELELNSDLSFYLKELERFLKNKDFYPNLPIDNRVANFIKKGEEWWKFRIDNIEKSILSQKEASRMEFLHGKVKTSFLNNLLKKYEETGDLYFQKELYWQDTIRGYSFSAKGLCDILIVTEDQVVEIDVKFSSHKTFEGWIYGAKEMSYAIQKAYYYRGLRSNYKKTHKAVLVSR
jgi:hypothetical protein